jgi:hypothetical protein
MCQPPREAVAAHWLSPRRLIRAQGKSAVSSQPIMRTTSPASFWAVPGARRATFHKFAEPVDRIVAMGLLVTKDDEPAQPTAIQP